MRNWELREFLIKVNLPSPKHWVWISIRKLPILPWGVPNPIRLVLLLIPRIYLYTPYQYHFRPPHLIVMCTMLQSLKLSKVSNTSLFLDAMIMSDHRVQHPTSTAYIEYSRSNAHHTTSTVSEIHFLSSQYSHDYELTPACILSFWWDSIDDWPPPASSQWELKGIVTSSHSPDCKSNEWWIVSHQHLVRLPMTVYKVSSDLPELCPASPSSKSLHFGLGEGVIVHSITACKYIFKLVRLWPHVHISMASQMHHHIRLIMESKCISEFCPP